MSNDDLHVLRISQYVEEITEIFKLMIGYRKNNILELLIQVNITRKAIFNN